MQYIAAAAFNVGKLPDFVTFEEGATIGVGCVAAAAALYDGLAIPPRGHNFSVESDLLQGGDRPWILVWGASSVTGMMATQFAKQSGLRVFAVAGLQNAAELHKLGADRILDRSEPEHVITEAQKLPIYLGVDCVGQETATYAIRAQQLGGKLVYLVKKPKQGIVEEMKAQVTDILIKRFHEDEGYGRFLTDHISRSLLCRSIRPVRHELVERGFEAVEHGLERLRQNQVSGRKLVVALE